MKIIHFSTYDDIGAGLATYRFHRNLLNRGLKSILFVQKKTRADDTVIQIGKKSFLNNLFNKFEFFFLTSKNKYSFYNKGRYTLNNIGEINNKIDFVPDVVIFHWITNFLNPKVMIDLKNIYNPKFFWYLMDFEPLTGGCHALWGCQGYQKYCEKCPALKWPIKNRAKKTFNKKKKIIDTLDISTLSASSSLKAKIEKSTLFSKKKIFDLMIGIDENKFFPNFKEKNNIISGINTKKKIILFRSSTNERKGQKFFIESFKILIENNKNFSNEVYVVSIGEENITKILDDMRIENFHLKRLNSENQLADLYKISYMFVSTSVEDAGPMMINESIISGTPVVSFDMGVAKDIVNSNTGILIKNISSEHLALGIQKILNLNNNDYIQMKKNCRNLGMKLFSFETQFEIFKSLVDNNENSIQ